MIDLLNGDLANELKHMLFYLHHASVVRGLHREEFREFLTKAAASEMCHVREFQDVIVGLSGVPTTKPNSFVCNVNIETILRLAHNMERDVVENYEERIRHAQELGGVDGKYIEIFLEKQLEHSREDADHILQLLLPETDAQSYTCRCTCPLHQPAF